MSQKSNEFIKIISKGTLDIDQMKKKNILREIVKMLATTVDKIYEYFQLT